MEKFWPERTSIPGRTAELQLVADETMKTNIETQSNGATE
jgi:hypothetical protein